MRTLAVTGILALGLLLTPDLLAQGQGKPGGGKGRTKKQFKVDFQSDTKNRLFLKIDVASLLAQLENIGTPSRNDDLANYEFMLTIGDGSNLSEDQSNAFEDAFDNKGKINKTTLKVKLTANGRILHVDLRGNDLATLMGLDPADEGKNLQIEVPIKVSVTPPQNDPDAPAPEAIDLFDEIVTFKYMQKADKTAAGKNF